jgi:hypothetical protein
MLSTVPQRSQEDSKAVLRRVTPVNTIATTRFVVMVK